MRMISWQGHHFDDASGTVLAQASFQEGSQTVKYVYLIGNASDAFSAGSSATIGIQSKQQLSAAEWNCNFGHDGVVANGLRIAATHLNGVQPA